MIELRELEAVFVLVAILGSTSSIGQQALNVIAGSMPSPISVPAIFDV